jgi:hypothetical protein
MPLSSVQQSPAGLNLAAHGEHLGRCGRFATGRHESMDEGCEPGAQQPPRETERKDHVLKIALADFGWVFLKKVHHQGVSPRITGAKMLWSSEEFFPNISTLSI